MVRLIPLLFLLIIVTHPNFSQTSSDSLALLLLEVNNSKNNYDQIIALMMMESDYGSEEQNELLKDFFLQYYCWDSLKYDYAKLYSNEFSNTELSDIITFYKSPVGHKMSLKLPTIMAKIQRIMSKRSEATKPILDSIMQENYLTFLRDTSSLFQVEPPANQDEANEPIDTTINLDMKSSDCEKFKHGKFVMKDDTSGYYIIRNDSIQHEIFDYLNIDMELKVEWINNCEYNLIFIKNKNKKFSIYEPGEVINIKISEVRGDEYDCIMRTRKGITKHTLVKVE
ncbi:MAG: DUF2059 domain-containing protein [Ignavibacteriaceae bacterium]